MCLNRCGKTKNSSWSGAKGTNFRAISLDPPPDGDVIGVQARLGEQLLDVAVRKGKRKYHPTASRMTSGSNCRHLNKPQTEAAWRSIRPAYYGLPVTL